MPQKENTSHEATQDALEKKSQFDFQDLITVMERLLAPDGCPWDREQTHESLKRYLIEESYEVLDAVDQKNDMQLCEELGDVLLQVVFHAQIAESFSISDVIAGVCKKMIHRHPHVFSDVTVQNADEVLVNWEEIKRHEKGVTDRTTILKNVPSNLPALMRAYKVQQKAAEAGFDWDDIAPVFDKVQEEIAEVKEALQQAETETAADNDAEADDAGSENDDAASPDVEPDAVAKDTGAKADAVTNDTGTESDAAAGPDVEPDAVTDELGDLLFAVVNLARFAKVHPELALTAATEKFIRRFSLMESIITGENRQLEGMGLDVMDQYWERAKSQLNQDKKDLRTGGVP